MSAEQAAREAEKDRLSNLLAEVLDDYLDQCDSLDDVDSQDLGEQLAAVVYERRMPPGVHYVSNVGEVH